MFAPLVLSRSINTPTDKLSLDQSTGELTSARARKRARVHSLAPARSPLYRYFCSGLSFLSGAPLLHPTMVYLKCHGGEGVHAHAHAQCSKRCWPTGWLRALYRPCCQTAYIYVRVHACARLHVHTANRQSTQVWPARARARLMHTYEHTASPFSAAVPISGGTASRCIREVHWSYTRRGFPISFTSSFFPFFSLNRLPPFHSLPPNFASKLFYVRRIQVTRRILINNMTTDLCAPLPIVLSFLSTSSNHTNWLLYQLVARWLLTCLIVPRSDPLKGVYSCLIKT